jgi:hypothetical protein
VTSAAVRRLVAAAATAAAADGSIHALDLATAAERVRWPMQLLTRPDYEYVWGGRGPGTDRRRPRSVARRAV